MRSPRRSRLRAVRLAAGSLLGTSVALAVAWWRRRDDAGGRDGGMLSPPVPGALPLDDVDRDTSVRGAKVRPGPADGEPTGAPGGRSPEELADEVARSRRGTPEDRGRGRSYQLDIGRLERMDGMEPVVQYLTYIQSRRGEESSILFVRYDDLDAMASMDEEDVTVFLERLDHLGVVISSN